MIHQELKASSFLTIHIYEDSYQFFSTTDKPENSPKDLFEAMKLVNKVIKQQREYRRNSGKLWANISGGNLSEFGMSVNEEKANQWIEAFETE